MSTISTDQVKELRDKTGVAIMQCRKALEDAGGDMEKAIMLLKKKGADVASKKSDRELGAGVVQAYIHNSSTVGAMVELWCETDFVANNDAFKTLARDIAMQIAAASPEYRSVEDIPSDERERAKDLFAKEVEGKPEDLKATILEGKISAYFKERVLLEQPFIKNDTITVSQMITESVHKFGEKIQVGKFVKFSISK